MPVSRRAAPRCFPGVRRQLAPLVLLTLLLTLPGPALAQAATPTGSPPPARVPRTLVYHELTAFQAGPNDGGDEAPLFSADGQHLAFARAPGAPDPAQPNRRISRLFVMD